MKKTFIVYESLIFHSLGKIAWLTPMGHLCIGTDKTYFFWMAQKNEGIM